MAVKKKRKTNIVSKGSPGENYFTISMEKKKKILGIFLIVFSILLLISILSYSRYDKAILNYQFSDLFKVFNSNSDFVKKAESTHNWLGIFGAYISDFSINSTIGIFSAI
ncbi:MAG: DNA translocase FtsK 4TM domain-containing protein, partial [Ignavibacteriaceae bacterium]